MVKYSLLVRISCKAQRLSSKGYEIDCTFVNLVMVDLQGRYVERHGVWKSISVRALENCLPLLQWLTDDIRTVGQLQLLCQGLGKRFGSLDKQQFCLGKRGKFLR